jgi:hypothetical protein
LLWSEEVAESNNRATACRRVYHLVVVRKNISREKQEQRLFDEVRSFFYMTHELRVASRPSQVPSEGDVTCAAFSPGSRTVATGAKDVRGRHVDVKVIRGGHRVLASAARPNPRPVPLGNRRSGSPFQVVLMGRLVGFNAAAVTPGMGPRPHRLTDALAVRTPPALGGPAAILPPPVGTARRVRGPPRAVVGTRSGQHLGQSREGPADLTARSEMGQPGVDSKPAR